MDLQKILEYQKIDSQIYQFEVKLKNSDVAKKYATAMKAYKNKNEDMIKSIRDADEIAILVDRHRQTYKKINDEINDLINEIDSFEELKEIDKYEKKIAQYQKDLLNIEHELTKLAKKMDDCIKNSQECLNNLANLEKNIKLCQVAIQELKNSMLNEVKQLKSKMEDLKKDIPKDIIEKYTSIRKGGKMPVLVECSDNFNSCTGCGMDVPNNLQTKLRDGEIVECPNCGRMIYSNKK